MIKERLSPIQPNINRKNNHLSPEIIDHKKDRDGNSCLQRQYRC